uniref:Vacuolar protein sorting-associated protein 28 homolog n=1 Tax=Pyramimonas obovata TaxID=1411642 RepID=A0A7S0WSL7_9CHLO|mmetsp:Transcript_3694/g.7623  ORF Transcript_3694/g.7623 Transcript_3694/m.7623 type:complete len:224 (+) Transcript_3694:784-1455(+)
MATSAGGSGENFTPVTLWTNKKEKEAINNKADLFALIKTVDRLEKAYVRDAISAKEYETTCLNMIAKFKTLMNTIQDQVPSVMDFMKMYHMECPAAVNRLLVSGIPATIEHGNAGRSSTAGGGGSEVVVAETVQLFITTMDALKINMTAVDNLYPLLTDLVQSMNKLVFLEPEFEGKVKVKEWLTRLNKMRASDELSEDESRQLLFDLESSYGAVVQKLKERH